MGAIIWSPFWGFGVFRVWCFIILGLLLVIRAPFWGQLFGLRFGGLVLFAFGVFFVFWVFLFFGFVDLLFIYSFNL